MLSHSAVPDSLRPLQPFKVHCLWDFAGKNTGAGCHTLLQGNLPYPEINPMSSALVGGFFITSPPGKPHIGSHFSHDISLTESILTSLHLGKSNAQRATVGPWTSQKVGLAPESFFQISMGVCGWKGITVSAGHLWDLKVDTECAKVSPENPRVEVNGMGSMGPASPPSVKVTELTCTTLRGPLQETASDCSPARKPPPHVCCPPSCSHISGPQRLIWIHLIPSDWSLLAQRWGQPWGGKRAGDTSWVEVYDF